MQLLASAVGQQGKCGKCGTVVAVSFGESSSTAANTPATATPRSAPPQSSIAIDTSPKRTPANRSNLPTKKRKITPNRITVAVISGVVAVVFVFGPILSVYLGQMSALRRDYQKAEKKYEGALRARIDRVRLANSYLEEGRADVALRQLNGLKALERLNEATDRSTELLVKADSAYEYAYREFDQACRNWGIKNERRQETPLSTSEMREKWQEKTGEKWQDNKREQQLNYVLKQLKPRHYKVENGEIELDLFSNAFAVMNLSHLKGQTEVTSLNLSGNATLRDADLVHLEGLANLQTLNLNFTKITDAGLVHLQGLTNLEHLNISATQITDKGLVEIQEWLPDCEITHP